MIWFTIVRNITRKFVAKSRQELLDLITLLRSSNPNWDRIVNIIYVHSQNCFECLFLLPCVVASLVWHFFISQKEPFEQYLQLSAALIVKLYLRFELWKRESFAHDALPKNVTQNLFQFTFDEPFSSSCQCKINEKVQSCQRSTLTLPRKSLTSFVLE